MFKRLTLLFVLSVLVLLLAGCPGQPVVQAEDGFLYLEEFTMLTSRVTLSGEFAEQRVPGSGVNGSATYVIEDPSTCNFGQLFQFLKGAKGSWVFVEREGRNGFGIAVTGEALLDYDLNGCFSVNLQDAYNRYSLYHVPWQFGDQWQDGYTPPVTEHVMTGVQTFVIFDTDGVLVLDGTPFSEDGEEKLGDYGAYVYHYSNLPAESGTCVPQSLRDFLWEHIGEDFRVLDPDVLWLGAEDGSTWDYLDIASCD